MAAGHLALSGLDFRNHAATDPGGDGNSILQALSEGIPIRSITGPGR